MARRWPRGSLRQTRIGRLTSRAERKLELVTDALLKRGYKTAAVEKILGGNLKRVLADIWSNYSGIVESRVADLRGEIWLPRQDECSGSLLCIYPSTLPLHFAYADLNPREYGRHDQRCGLY